MSHVKQALFCLVAMSSLAACADDPDFLDQPNAVDPSELGTIQLKLSLPNGDSIDRVEYLLSNGATTVQSGAIKTDHSEAIIFQLGKVPPGPGYVISLSAVTTKGGKCSGAAGPFHVENHATTPISVPLACYAPSVDAGNVLVNGAPFNCPTWVSLATVDPDHQNTNGNATSVGHDITLIATATAIEPRDLTYTWSADDSTIGVFGANVTNGGTATTTFRCKKAGTTTITLVVGAGPIPAGGVCDPALTTVSTPVICFDSAPVQACNTTTVAGNDAPVTRIVEMGRTSGTFDFSFETFTIRDRIVVSYEGATLFDTGCVGASGRRALDFAGASSQVQVEVIPNCGGPGMGTAWEFSASCPR